MGRIGVNIQLILRPALAAARVKVRALAVQRKSFPVQPPIQPLE
jgi:hypothetical protein